MVSLAAKLFSNMVYAKILAGVSCIIGHIFPVFMHFRGGKGLACLGGVILAYNWRLFVVMLLAELLLVLAVIAYFANQIIGPGANYLYMARPEDTPSVLDILPPNFVLRVAVMMLVVTILFAAAYLPWFIKDRKAKKETAKA